MGNGRDYSKYSLDEIQTNVKTGNLLITKTATKDAFYIDMNNDDIREIVMKLTKDDFYKTMQSEKNPLLWHDVYNYDLEDEDLVLYIKLQMRGKAVVISFKEK